MLRYAPRASRLALTHRLGSVKVDDLEDARLHLRHDSGVSGGDTVLSRDAGDDDLCDLLRVVHGEGGKVEVDGEVAGGGGGLGGEKAPGDGEGSAGDGEHGGWDWGGGLGH